MQGSRFFLVGGEEGLDQRSSNLLESPFVFEKGLGSRPHSGADTRGRGFNAYPG
jgi:hypothetical protein